MMNSDEQLIDGCLKGDRLAQRRLYDIYSRRMFGVCLRYSGNREEAEEILQEGLLKVFNKLGDFKKEGALEGWIRRIVINTALDFYRRNKSRQMETEWQENISVSIEHQSSLNTKELLQFIQSLHTGYFCMIVSFDSIQVKHCAKTGRKTLYELKQFFCI